MAIKETTRKIHFRPYISGKGRPTDVDPAPTANVSRKHGTITISKGAVLQMNMGGKFVKIFYEPTKKIIGWQIREGGMELEEAKSWKLCTPNPKTGVVVLSIRKLLAEFKGLSEDSYPGLPVQRYREMGQLDQYSGQVFYYVEVKKDESADTHE